MNSDKNVRPLLLAADSMVDHYQVIRSIGRGGMGEVYLARDTKLGRRVALKVIQRRHLPSDARMVERFLEEARITASFNHPHIVTVYGVGEHAGSPYLALEFVEGETLRQRMNAERMAAKEVMRIGLAIAQALAEAHKNRILHRDLKPENILLAKDGRLRVLDLGLAKLLGDSPATAASDGMAAGASSSSATDANDAGASSDALAAMETLPSAAALEGVALASTLRPTERQMAALADGEGETLSAPQDP
ncbi:MAG: serine/threonine-protein kinase, partial [Pseudomonadota bacterium]